MMKTTMTPAWIRGTDEFESTTRGIRPHRLPPWAREQFNDPQLLAMQAQPSGVRVAVQTAARSIELTVHSNRITHVGIDRPRGAIDLVIDDRIFSTHRLAGGDAIEIDPSTGTSTFVPGPLHTARFEDLPVGDKVVELWLPHNESVELIELRSDAPLSPATACRPVWVHHGSSISHGSNATSPARTWPAVAARQAKIELRNLGLGGSALVDPFTARVIRDTPADAISLKLGINIVNLDAMRLRTFVPAVHGFLDTIRDGHPSTPLLLISPIYCGIHEDSPGPVAIDPTSFEVGRAQYTTAGTREDVTLGRLNLNIIREALSEIVETRKDPELRYLNGTELYGAHDARSHPLPDNLHPDTASHESIGQRFARTAFSDGGVLPIG